MSHLLVDLYAAHPYEVRSTTRYHWDSRQRDAHHLIFQYTWAGCGAYADAKGEQPIPAGHGMFTTSQEESAYYFPPWAKQAWIFGWLGLGGADETWKWIRESHGTVVPLDREGEAITAFSKLAHGYEHKRFEDSCDASEQIFRFLMGVVRELSSVKRSSQSPVEVAAEYLEEHHREPVNIKELASRFGMSREHFTRAFTAKYGRSPGAALRDRRMRTAARLLETTRRSIADVARLSGFASASHFSRVFRGQSGRTPERHRERAGARTERTRRLEKSQ